MICPRHMDGNIGCPLMACVLATNLCIIISHSIFSQKKPDHLLCPANQICASIHDQADAFPKIINPRPNLCASFPFDTKCCRLACRKCRHLCQPRRRRPSKSGLGTSSASDKSFLLSAYDDGISTHLDKAFSPSINSSPYALKLARSCEMFLIKNESIAKSNDSFSVNAIEFDGFFN